MNKTLIVISYRSKRKIVKKVLLALVVMIRFMMEIIQFSCYTNAILNSVR